MVYYLPVNINYLSTQHITCSLTISFNMRLKVSQILITGLLLSYTLSPIRETHYIYKGVYKTSGYNFRYLDTRVMYTRLLWGAKLRLTNQPTFKSISYTYQNPKLQYYTYQW